GMQAPCWAEAAQAWRGHPNAISPAAEVRVDGAKVALARGLAPATLSATAAAASRFDARPPAPAPSLGDLPAEPDSARARVVEGRFVSKRLGVEGNVPAGFEADVDQPAAELVLRKLQPEARASLLFVPEPVTPELVDGLLQTAATEFANAVGGSSLKLRGAQRTT